MTAPKRDSKALSGFTTEAPGGRSNHRSLPRAQRAQEARYRGYRASKRRYCYGVNSHRLVTAQGEPVAIFMKSGSLGDVNGLPVLTFDRPEGSTGYADSAFTDYTLEDMMAAAGLQLSPYRQNNAKRPGPPWGAYRQARGRQRVETADSLIERLWPKHSHAVTAQGFELKVRLFVLAGSVSVIV